MYSLLRIDASARGPASVSRTVADTFETAWLARLPDSRVVVRDLATEPIPHVPAELVPRSHGHRVDAVAARLQDELVDELLAADAVVVSTPMYNLGVPSVVKAWIDHVVLLGRTLPFPGSPAPTTGVPVTVVAAFGGGYGPGSPREGWDHLRPYLDAVFAGILGMDVGFVTVELTLASTTPGMEALTELAGQSVVAGLTAATERADRVAALVAQRTPRSLEVPRAS